RLVYVKLNCARGKVFREWVGETFRCIFVGFGVDRQTHNGGVQQHFLAFGRQHEFNKFLCAFLVWSVLNDADVRRDDGSHAGVNQINRETGSLGGQTKKVDHNTKAGGAGVNGIRHTEAALRDGVHVSGDPLPGCPTLIPTFTLQHRFDGEVGGTRAGRRRHGYVAVLFRAFQVVPLFSNGQIIGSYVAGVVHDAVTRSSEAIVRTIWVVDWIAADGVGDAFRADFNFF